MKFGGTHREIVDTKEVFSYEFLSGELEDVLKAIHESSQQRQVIVNAINAHGISEAASDPELHSIFSNGVMNIPDGMPLVWISRLKRNPLNRRFPGRQFFLDLCSFAERHGYSIFLLGDTTDTLEGSIKTLGSMFPSLRVAGFYSPSFPFEISSPETDHIIECINNAHPDFVFVALGVPKQEKLMIRMEGKIQAKLMMGIGGTLQYLVGAYPVAPLWMQDAGLEWFWRFAHEPNRLWRRYTVGNLHFLYLTIKYLIKKGRARKAG